MKCEACAAQQKGLSLVEIMITLAISSLLITGMVQVFSQSKASYQLQEGLGRMQENARFALDFLARDIRQAGYIGCKQDIDTLENRVLNTPGSFNPLSGIQGWEFTGGTGTATGSNYALNANEAKAIATHGNNLGWQGWMTASGEDALDSRPKAISGSDIMRIWYTMPESARILSFDNAPDWDTPTLITVHDNNAINPGDIVLLSDCQSASLMQVCSIEKAGVHSRLFIAYQGRHCSLGNRPGALPVTLASNAEITPITSRTYFIGKKSHPAGNSPSLYYANLNASKNDASTGRAEELIEGVENMQILYGEDTDNDKQVNIYHPANQVSNWRRVIALKIGLLMHTVREVDTQTHGGSYNVNGTNISIPIEDRRPRKVFNMTILLRNRSS